MIDHAWIAAHTTGFDETAAHIRAMAWSDLEASSGATTAAMRSMGELLGRAKTAVLVWSMGVTQHARGENAVRAIINLALSNGFVGRDKCGLMPIRGHSGVQGGAEMGAYATSLPGSVAITAESAAHLSEQWGFAVPDAPGLAAPDMLDQAAAGKLDVLIAMGGNFLETMPDPAAVASALATLPLRVHLDIVLSSQMLIDPAESVILLPATTRYEIPGGITQTSTERRVMFSPEIEGRRIGESRPEWEIFRDLAVAVRPERANALAWTGPQEIRDEIARIVPAYDGIQNLHKTGDQFQYGGRHLAPDGTFPTADGRGQFSAVQLPGNTIPAGMFAVSTRRGKQFNSMVHEKHDAITGAGARDAVFMNARDAAQLGLKDGDQIVLQNEFGTLQGRVFCSRVTSRTLQIYWPEGNILLDYHRRSPHSHVPDYNAVV
ncbi:MAG TPA: molybdopterin-dependent oxidoreductase, partial [Thermomicrobiales bacterium]|nr:molybdopterin-dependent oxidoreductase [Thermomicrobiales bacterium]